MMKERIYLRIILFLWFLNGIHSFRRVCYYTNWAQYRPREGKYIPENIDPYLCSHIIYAFAKLDGNKLKAYEWNDESTEWMRGMFAKFNDVKLKNPTVKTLLAVGGWNMGSKPFTKMVKTAASRQEFAKTTIRFLRERNFDGLDLDWEYPANRGSPPEDRMRFTELVKELRSAFDREGRQSGSTLLLTSAVAAGRDKIDSGYDVMQLGRYMDFVSIMTYDLHGSWENVTGHNSPLFARPDEYGTQAQLNLAWAMEYWYQKGLPKEKMNVGLPLYGRSFSLADPYSHDVGAAVKPGDAGKGRAGKFTREAGFLAYYEVCELLKNGASKYYIQSQKVPYLVDGNQWVGYDDPDSLALKVQFTKNNNYGGIMVWALDLDDFNDQCGTGQYPLLKRIVNELGGLGPIMANIPVQQGPAIQQQNIIPDVPTVIERKTRPAKAGFRCEVGIDGYFPSPDSCSEYYQCTEGNAYHFHCAPGLEFSSVDNRCDWPEKVQCSKTSNNNAAAAAAAVATAAVAAPTTYVTPPSTYPPQPAVNEVLPDTVPSWIGKQQAQLQPQSPQTWTQPTGLQPAVPTQPSVNDLNMIQQAPPSIAPSQSVNNRVGGGGWGWALLQDTAPAYWNLFGNAFQQQGLQNTFCVGKADGMYPDPQSCERYYECINGESFHGSCGPGQGYDQQFGTCDHISRVQNCQTV